jgi:hypothetical protein
MFMREMLLGWSLALASATVAAAAPCKVVDADRTAVAETVRTMYGLRMKIVAGAPIQPAYSR